MNEPKSPVHAYAEFFEQLTPDDLQRFGAIFSDDVHFKDPFNDVHGLQAVVAVFSHMFEQCAHLRFDVTDSCQTGARAFLRWDFHFTPKGGSGEYHLHGLSRVCFDANGRVNEHIDYWDPAEQIYGRLPIIGWLLERLRRRLSAGVRVGRVTPTHR